MKECSPLEVEKNERILCYVESFLDGARCSFDDLKTKSTKARYAESIANAFPGSLHSKCSTNKESGDLTFYDNLTDIASTISSVIWTVGITAKLLNLGYQTYDTIKREKQQLITKQIISAAKPTSLEFENAFRKIFVNAAIQAYFAYENQLDNIYRGEKCSTKLPSTESSLISLDILGIFAGQVCFSRMVETASTDNIVRSLTELDNFKRIDSWWKQKTIEKLRLYEKHKEVFVKKSKFHFYDDPIPTFFPRKDGKCSRQSGGSATESEKQIRKESKDDGPSKLYVMSEDKKKLKEKKGLLDFRRPFKFEDFEVQKSITIPIPRDCENPSYFTWTDHEHLVDEMCTKLSSKNPPEKHTGNWDELIGNFDELKETLKEMIKNQGDIKSELASLHQKLNDQMVYIETFMNGAPVPISGIRFNIENEIQSFQGRDQFLTDFHSALQGQLDVLVLTGLGGIGKTQTVRKYISKFGNDNYDNIIWLNAEKPSTIRDSILNLNDHKALQIPMEWNDSDIKVMKEIYDKICAHGKSNLIIFDNAQTYKSDAKHENGIKPYLPYSLDRNLKKPVVVVTSRRTGWTRFSKFRIMPEMTVPPMSDPEAIAFILKELKLDETDKNKSQAKDFAQLFAGLPLALEQAVAYIRQEAKYEMMQGNKWEIETYTKIFQSHIDQIEDFPPQSDSTSTSTLILIWKVTLNKIEKSPHGDMALKILEILSLLHADNVPTPFLAAMCSNSLATAEGTATAKDITRIVMDGLLLLEQYSMVTLTTGSVSIHRQVQFFFQQRLKKSQQFQPLLETLILRCHTYLLEKASSGKPNSNQVLINLLSLAYYQLRWLPMNHECIRFTALVGKMEIEAGNYADAQALHSMLYENRKKNCGSLDIDTLNARINMALTLDYQGEFEEALNMYEHVVNECTNNDEVGEDHESTHIAKQNMADVLRALNSEDSLNRAEILLESVMEKREKILNELQEADPEGDATAVAESNLMNTKNQLALVLMNKEEREKALELIEEVCQQRERSPSLGADHPLTLGALHNKGCILNGMKGQEELEKARHVLEHVYAKRREILQEKHVDTLRTRHYIGMNLEFRGMKKEALEVYVEVFACQCEVLGRDHPRTLDTKKRLNELDRRLNDGS